MLAVERQRLILESITRDRRGLVSELSLRYGVSDETIRRDLQKLERDGLVARTHGGAVPAAEPEDLPYPTRQTTNIAQKRRIAGLAAGLVGDGDAVMIDSSSTAFELLAPLAHCKGLTIITNSVRIIASPACEPHSVISVGGELRQQSLTLCGPVALDSIARFSADLAFISCKALSPDTGIMVPNLADAEVKRAFIANARRVCLLADGSKFGQTALTGLCGLDRIDILVTDRRPPDAWFPLAERHGVRLIHG